jgi:dTDP-D-glucose 4,6-dehydratase
MVITKYANNFVFHQFPEKFIPNELEKLFIIRKELITFEDKEECRAHEEYTYQLRMESNTQKNVFN